MNETLRERGFSYPWGDVTPLLHRADLFLINLEFVLTKRTEPWTDGARKAFNFRADPAVAESLKIAGVNFAALANNHIGDFGTEGLIETLTTLDAKGIIYAGAGRDLAEASSPACLEEKFFRIAILAYSDQFEQWRACEKKPGLNYTPISIEQKDFETVKRAIESVRTDSDFVIFSIHWGPNMRERPTEDFRDFAHSVIEAGVDIFWGHSAHLVQGVELYRDRLILYDTGDFVDDYAVDPILRNDLSALFIIECGPERIERFELHPVRIASMQVNLARGEDRDWILRRVKMLSAEFGTELVEENGRLNLTLGRISPGGILPSRRKLHGPTAS